jgi:ubiquinone/menaquinone biosynthesis C-methylase UbiE
MRLLAGPPRLKSVTILPFMNIRADKTVDPLNYDSIAGGYDKRYRSAYKPEGIAAKLVELIKDVGAVNVLEVGCGTGYWLDILQGQTRVLGIDMSFGMLRKAAEHQGRFSLIRGDASLLPFREKSFDMVFCVNALHHFANPLGFIIESHKLLKPNGALAVIGMNPHTDRDKWFIYDCFPGTREADIKRYPSPGTITDWMISAGFGEVRWQVAERIRNDRHGNEVLQLTKDFTSQLTLLSQNDYAKGMAVIESILQEAEKIGLTPVFPVDISLSMVTGRVKDDVLKVDEPSESSLQRKPDSGRYE